MKRIFPIFLTLLLLLSLCACTADPQSIEPTDLPTDPVCQHSWTGATCTDSKTCTLCGAKDGTALGHDYETGICTVCKAEDSSYDPLVSGTWLYLTKERWEILDFQIDGTCDMKTVNGAPTSAVTLEQAVSTAVTNLQRQYKDNWETYAASKYYVFKVEDYYYVANMTATTAEYTAAGKTATIEQEGLVPVQVRLLSNKALQEVITEQRYINMPVQFISNLLYQYENLNG